MSGLLDRRFVVVTGKGGVGRSTAAVTLALAAGKAGKRTCVVELYGNRRIAQWFGLGDRSYKARSIAPNVDTMSLTAMDAMDDFGQRKLKLDALVRMVLNSRVTHAFVDAIPGLHDLVQLGKLENMLLEPLPGDAHYDLVIVDAPATGHGLTLLAAPQAMSELTKIGPFHDLASIIARLLDDPKKSAVVLVTLPEELPVNEGIELALGLGDNQKLLHSVIMNQARPPSLPPVPAWDHIHALLSTATDPDLRELLRVAEPFWRRQLSQEQALHRLKTLAELLNRQIPIAQLPKVEHGELSPDDLHILAEQLLPQVTT